MELEPEEVVLSVLPDDRNRWFGCETDGEVWVVRVDAVVVTAKPYFDEANKPAGSRFITHRFLVFDEEESTMTPENFDGWFGIVNAPDEGAALDAARELRTRQREQQAREREQFEADAGRINLDKVP